MPEGEKLCPSSAMTGLQFCKVLSESRLCMAVLQLPTGANSPRLSASISRAMLGVSLARPKSSGTKDPAPRLHVTEATEHASLLALVYSFQRAPIFGTLR
jgi:hypothetical protein